MKGFEEWYKNVDDFYKRQDTHEQAAKRAWYAALDALEDFHKGPLVDSRTEQMKDDS
jgi:hypothetical protein